ncbi:hypothetical protein LBMAG45_01600 [Nitrospirota bacterium]|nr:hypothetical protein LBMAG45_01600 [Nitrospirota bacterium]
MDRSCVAESFPHEPFPSQEPLKLSGDRRGPPAEATLFQFSQDCVYNGLHWTAGLAEHCLYDPVSAAYQTHDFPSAAIPLSLTETPEPGTTPW